KLLFSYAGKILRINLSKNKIISKELEESFAKNFLGGRGFNSKFLYDNLKQGISPFDPENILIFSVGLLTGTMAPSSGRYTVSGKSPLTGILGDANSGGRVG
ncbi:MAG: aldehyde ferredoxin oxidoreductase N-terminal domain-containing protein, partial [Candidatus Bathyarchaeia archaeon]